MFRSITATQYYFCDKDNVKNDDTRKKILSLLPHGSGINYDYYIKIGKDYIKVFNCYDRMNEFGFYDGVFPFSVKFTKNNFNLHFHNLNSYGYRLINNEMLKDYLQDVYYDSYTALKELIDTIIKEENKNEKNS